MCMQITLALLKPDIACNHKIVQLIEKRILDNRFLILKRKEVRWQRRHSEAFYAQHHGRFFHQRLVEFMTCGPLIALLLAKDNAITDWRALMGPTKTYKAQFAEARSIRGEFGLSDTRNTVHGSDSLESAITEAELFFPQLDLVKLTRRLQTERNWNEIPYDEHRGVHEVDVVTGYENALLQKSPDQAILHKSLGDPNIWSEYYESRDGTTEWFASYEDLKETLQSIFDDVTAKKTVLDVGCGESSLGPSLARDFTHLDVYCLDASVRCLKTLSERHGDTSSCTYVVGDARQHLPFLDNSLDVVIDKGTSDAVCRHPDGEKHLNMMLTEMFRTMRNDAVLIQVSTEAPEVRLDELRSFSNNCRVSFCEVASDAAANVVPVYVYTVRKG